MKKRVMLFGASGAIGSYLFKYLTASGNEVIPVVRNEDGVARFSSAVGGNFPSQKVKIADVTNIDSLFALLKGLGRLDVVVYAVGCCSAKKKVKKDKWMEVLPQGFIDVRSAFFEPSRVFAVIGSAITHVSSTDASRLWPHNSEGFLLAQHELDEVVEVCRKFSVVHLIKPGPVIDTPFHTVPGGYPSYYPGVSRIHVAKALCEALKSPDSVTRFVQWKSALEEIV